MFASVHIYGCFLFASCFICLPKLSTSQQCNEFIVKLTNDVTADEMRVGETSCDGLYCWSLLTTLTNNHTKKTERWAKGGCTTARICEPFATECAYGKDGVLDTEMGSAAVSMAARRDPDVTVLPNSICCCAGDKCNSLALLLVEMPSRKAAATIADASVSFAVTICKPVGHAVLASLLLYCAINMFELR